MNRLAKHSLDEDNRKMYSQRAEKWQEKAEEIEERLSVPVVNSEESGIIKGKGSANRETVVTNVRIVGKIDIEKYKCITENIITEEVIITDERIQHI